MNTNFSLSRIWVILTVGCLLALSCNLISLLSEEGTPAEIEATTVAEEIEVTEVPEESEAGETSESIPTELPSQESDNPTSMPPADLPTSLVDPDDLVYLGAFRLPETGDELGWGYSGYAMTYYPEGDPQGTDDGFPGSLFVLGHDQSQVVGEISIPAPIISESKNSTELPTADMLQPFNDIRGGMFEYLEVPRAGLAYLPPQGSQTTGKLYFCWGQHFQFEREPSHGWSELDLSEPNPVGLWHVGEYTNYITNDYLFEIPQAWADTYTPGLRLATGRFRDGHWGGLGPALLAIGPYNEGNPPPPGSTLEQVTPLLLYGEHVDGSPEIDISGGHQMDSYSEPDEWSGGAWLTVGDNSAVILVGTKAIGRSWYGFSNGVEFPISGDADEEYPEVPPWPHDDRGWWSEDISAQILFFDPSELGSVARGEIEAWEPQPYAVMTLDDTLFDPGFDYERAKRFPVGAVDFDRENKLLYIVERRADENDNSIIHVFRVEP
jgi:hypothetical protein